MDRRRSPLATALDIEKILRWAYRDELAKRVTSSAEELWQSLQEWRLLGAFIDRPASGAAQRYDIGVPDQDALVVERAASLLPDVVIDWRSEGAAVLGELLALVDPRPPPENEPAGSLSRVSWPLRDGRRLAAAVEPPRRVIMVRSLRPSALVIAHASMGSRPDWHSEPPRPYPILHGPRPKIVGESRGRGRYAAGSYCPLTWEPSPITIAEARADYLAWWRGLALLREQLAGRLKRYLPTGPDAPETPWITSPGPAADAEAPRQRPNA